MPRGNDLLSVASTGKPALNLRQKYRGVPLFFIYHLTLNNLFTSRAPSAEFKNFLSLIELFAVVNCVRDRSRSQVIGAVGRVSLFHCLHPVFDYLPSVSPDYASQETTREVIGDEVAHAVLACVR